MLTPYYSRRRTVFDAVTNHVQHKTPRSECAFGCSYTYTPKISERGGSLIKLHSDAYAVL